MHAICTADTQAYCIYVYKFSDEYMGCMQAKEVCKHAHMHVDSLQGPSMQCIDSCMYVIKERQTSADADLVCIAGPMEGGGRAIHLEVPPGALGPSVTLEVHSAVIPNRPFTLPEGYQFGSHVVYIYFDGHHVTSPLHLHLPHWYGGEDQVQDGLSFAMAPHTLKELGRECV